MKKLFFILSILATISTYSQQKFEKQWTKVEAFEQEGKMKSANELVAAIYKKAKKKDNSKQLIKSLLYQSKFALVLQEDAELLVAQNLEKEISEATFPTNAILQSVLADFKWQYLQKHRWQIYNRTKTTEIINTDFRTWDLNSLFTSIHKDFKQSIANLLQLQNIPITNYNYILIKGTETEHLRPTLYDLLANRALAFFKTNESRITKPKERFHIDNNPYFSPSTEFTELHIETTDSVFSKYEVLKTYQKLEQFHLAKKQTNALIEVYTNRLQFVKNNTTLNSKNELYIKSLEQSLQQYKTGNAFALLKAHAAKAIYNISTLKHQPENKKKALEICENIIQFNPNSEGSIIAQNLQSRILQPILHLQNEIVISPNHPSKVWIEFNNVTQVYLQIFKIPTNFSFNKYSPRVGESKIKNYFTNHNPIKTIKVSLPQKGDYFKHSTEALIPKLKIGKYLILVTPNQEFNEYDLFAFSSFTTSNISVVESKLKNKKVFQIIHNSNGKAIKNATVTFGNIKKHTNEWGEVSFGGREKLEQINISYQKDSLSIGKRYNHNSYHKPKDESKKEKAKAFLFLDRSIYRPGQDVHFKGIVLSRVNYKSKVVADRDFKIIIRDANKREIKSFNLTTNEYGSFSEKFQLPKDGLTGNFTIKVEQDKKYFNQFNQAHSYFSVEEYKRPKFEVNFNPVKESYSVNDNICVTGTAKALLGTNISDAKVTYRVVRKTQYTHWRSWSRHYDTNEQEIAHGEISTNAKGEFDINFNAQSDKTKAPKDLPIFSYEITANVTDINGETRSATTSVKVGYHTLKLSITTQDIWNVNTLPKLNINTTNLNGEFTPAKVNVKIYKLLAPKNVLRTRRLPVADTPLLTKEEFKKHFPNEAYKNENDYTNWGKGDLVYEKTMTIKDNPEPLTVSLLSGKDTEGRRSWQSGKHIIITEAIGNTKHTITEEKHISVRNEKDTILADNQLFDYQILNANTAKEDGFISIKLMSSCSSLTIFTEAYFNSKALFKENVALNGSKTFQIPLTQILKKKSLHPNASVSIQFSMVKHQDYKSVRTSVDLSTPQESLVIETNTFRNKLQPGGKEKWSFTVKNKKGVQAEVLASMYDASLDQFKPHNWTNIINIRDYYRNDVPYKHCNGFRSNRFNFYNSYLYQTEETIIPKIPTHFNPYGFKYNSVKLADKKYKLWIKHRDFERSIYKKDHVIGYVYDTNGHPIYGAQTQNLNNGAIAFTNKEGIFAIKGKKHHEYGFTNIDYLPIQKRGNSFGRFFVVMQTDYSPFIGDGYYTNKKRLIRNEKIKEYYLRAKSGDHNANFKQGDGDYGGIAGWSDYNSSGSKINSSKGGFQYSTNFRDGDAESTRYFSDFNYYRGNTFTKNKIGADGTVLLRGRNSIQGNKEVLIVIDGKIATAEQLSSLDPNSIQSTEILKNSKGTALYGSQGVNGVIVVTTGKAVSFENVKARKNLNETAFFYPHLKTNAKGDVSFEFETPEALTRWKVQLFGHTKAGVSGKFSQNVVTQKELMVIPNPPRFLREKDTIVFQTKIANLTDNTLNGFAKLELYNGVTGEVIDTELNNNSAIQNFSIDKKGNTSVSWGLTIPEGIQAVEYKVLAKAGNFTDGESSVLPVLTNNMLVTESIPITVRSNSSKTYSFNKLKSNTSTTLRNHQLTLEYTSNPAWYAIQSLPYLMEFPHECAEQTFSRYYANSIGSHILNSNPKIKTVFDSWKVNGKLTSKLEQNEEQKQILISETPWLRDAQSDAEKKKRLGLLFDLEKLASEEKIILKKLKQMQLPSGGFPWFSGGKANEYITRYIVAGFGHLQQLGVTDPSSKKNEILEKAIAFLDIKFTENHNRKLKHQTIENITIGNYELHYLYARSFFNNTVPFDKVVKPIVNTYINKAKSKWLDRTLLQKTILSMVLHRFNDRQLPQLILEHLKETSVTSDEKGMYWKSNTSGWYWHEAPIETQALIIEAFSEITEDKNTIEELQIWLLNNKRKQDWNTTKATTEATYALLLQENDWLSIEGTAKIKIGEEKINTKKLEQSKLEAGTGYFKTSWNTAEITPKMADISIKNTSIITQFGSYYWQYFEQLDKITNEEHTNDIKLHKELFLKKNTDNGPTLTKIENTNLKIGDLVTVRIELQVKDDFEFIHLKDMRASTFEPINVISSYKWQDGTGYYQSTKDVATHFFFDRLNKGTYVLEYDMRVNNAGDFSNGISTIQSMYAPEFSSHSKGVRVRVKK